MNARSESTGASVIPTVRYRDIGTAIQWLQKAFGLEPHRLVKDAHGRVLYGELTYGTGMVMVAPIQETPFGKLMVQPDAIGGVETQICYLFVEDAKAHYQRAKAAGAEILLDVEVEANGGRGYSCRDPEGHIWNFGTYDPWELRAIDDRKPSWRMQKALMACLVIGIAGGAYMHEPAREAAHDIAVAAFSKISRAIATAQAEQTPAARETEDSLFEVRDQLSQERFARYAAERHILDIREELARERRAREAAELAAKRSREGEAPNTSIALNAAEIAAAEARTELARLRSALETATGELSQARTAKEAAAREAEAAREQFAKLDAERESAERSAQQLRELAARERSRRIVAERTLRIAKESPYTPYPLN